MRSGRIRTYDQEFHDWNHKWSGYVWFLANHFTSNPHEKREACYEKTKNFVLHFKHMLDLHPNEKFFLSNDKIGSDNVVCKPSWRSNNFVNLACIDLEKFDDVGNYFEISFDDIVLILKQSYDLLEKNTEKFLISGGSSDLYTFSPKENQYYKSESKYDYGMTIYNIHSKLLL